MKPVPSGPANPKSHTFIFVGGHHRSGTSALYRLLGTDPRISCFRGTGAVEDEGQFLQTVYPPDNVLGGPGGFCLDGRAHLTNQSDLMGAAKSRLFSEWSPYWDLNKPFLAEKSPANLVRGRFLQEVFEDSRFIFITRHPIAACLAVSKWNRAYLRTLLSNWVNCHQLMQEDVKQLRKCVVLKYEDLVANPLNTVERISELLGVELEVDCSFLRGNLNNKYFSQWRGGDVHLHVAAWKKELKRYRNVIEIKYLERKYERFINEYGYSFREAY